MFTAGGEARTATELVQLDEKGVPIALVEHAGLICLITLSKHVSVHEDVASMRISNQVCCPPAEGVE